jgi:EpsI family protein
VGILHAQWGPKVAEGFFHNFSGWFIFVLSLIMLLTVMAFLAKIVPPMQNSWFGESPGSSRIGSTASGAPLASEHGGEDQVQKGRARSILLEYSRFGVALLLLGAMLLLMQQVNFREKIPVKKSLAQFPLQIGSWSGTVRHLEPRFLRSLKLSEYAFIDYQDDEGKNINLYIAYYDSQRKDGAIHSPTTCMPGSGWVFHDKGKYLFPISLNNDKRLEVRRAFIEKNHERKLAYYWFSQHGRVLTNLYQLKFFTFWGALTRQRTDGALIRLITPVYEQEGIAEAETRLQTFTAGTVKYLNDFIPE